MKNIVLFLTILALLLSGCDSMIKEVDPSRIPQTDQKMAVFCYISPQDTVLAAVITLSRTVFGLNTNTGDNTGGIAGATVTLSDGVKTVTLPYNTKDKVYRTDARLLPIRVGVTYTLTASLPTGQRVTAQTTVPPAVNLTEIKLDSGTARVPFNQSFSYKEYYARLVWRDTPNQTNYYRVFGDLQFQYEQLNPSKPSEKTTTTQTSFVNFNDGAAGAAYISDKNRDGESFISGRGVIYLPYTLSTNNQTTTVTEIAKPPIIVSGYLLNTDENYFRFHQALEQQDFTGDNPFAEPVLIPTNVQGGLGCFGSYNKSALKVRLK